VLSAAVVLLISDAPVDNVQEAETISAISSIAILPFVVHESEDSAIQVAETIRSMLIQTLSNQPDLKVTPARDTQAFAETSLSIREIGDKLSVSTVLEGAVQKTQGRVRVTIQLIDVRSDAHLWAETYHRDTGDLDSIVADVERNIVELGRE
jgi:TolB-like protein